MPNESTAELSSPDSNGVGRLERRLAEAFDTLWDDFVDPRDAYAGTDGELWSPVRTGTHGQAAIATPLDETQLQMLRDECRRFAVSNEFAINGHENRISYLVGPGHQYLVVVKKGSDAPDSLANEVQRVIDDFLHVNRWPQRQQEIVRRMDRDGEAFLRFFADRDGVTHVRFVEPDQVAAPPHLVDDPSARFGVLTESHDVEAVIGYYIDGQLEPAEAIQHRKANVDCNVKRGLPLYTAVRKNLRRAEKLLRNMSVVAEIQSAIALIRKHRSAASRSGVEQFVADQADSAGRSAGGRARWVSQYAAGTILDAPAGLEYDFPATGVDAASFVTILQAELRAIAARLVMPEFMFTSDASNASYSSTMIAEGPAVRMFERLQSTLVIDDCEVLWRVIDNAVRAGRLPVGVQEMVDVQAVSPSLNVRDAKDEAVVLEMAHRNGILSPQTWSQKLGLDYDQEQKNLSVHAENAASEEEKI